MMIDVRPVGELTEGDLVEMVHTNTRRTVAYGIVYYLWPDPYANTVGFTVLYVDPTFGISSEEFVEDADQPIGVVIS